MTLATAGLVVLAIAAYWAFFQVADWMLTGGANAWNIGVLSRMPAWHAPWLDPVVITLTQAGSATGLAILGLATIWQLRRKGHHLDAAVVALLLAGVAILTFGLKGVYLHHRPQIFPPLVAEHGYSFPSGHALAGWAFYLYLALWFAAARSWILAAAMALMAVALPLSRLYLGVHWPSDVLAGIGAGTFWLGLCLALRRHLTVVAAKDPIDR
jgi:membrane-associated phospholipid phosphatase